MMLKKGQTIIEVLIAAAIIAMALTAMVAVVTTAMARTREAKERIIAARLAQESAENMRTARDINGWSAFIAPSIVMVAGNSGTYVGCLYNNFSASNPGSLFSGSSVGANEAALNSAVSVTTPCVNSSVTNNNTTFRRATLVTFDDTVNPAYFQYKIVVNWSKSGGTPMYLDLAGVLYER